MCTSQNRLVIHFVATLRAKRLYKGIRGIFQLDHPYHVIAQIYLSYTMGGGFDDVHAM